MTELDPTTSSRRRFLASSAALAAGAAVGDAARGAQADGTAPLEAAYARIQARYPHSNVHRSNHVPMVVEALATLGRADAIGPWLDEHLEAYDPDEGPRNRIDAARWREVLGDHAYFTDWRELFLAELAADDWRAVLGRWVPRFTPGLAGAATHGVIRSGHAARALAAHDSAVRRAELATGLAYWAVNFEELPWDGSLAPERSVADALARVVLRRPAEEPPRGNIVTGLRALQDTPSFHPVAGWVGVEDPARTLGEMASAFARLYLANPERRIAFTHAITAPSALRLLVPYLDEETVRAATRRAWQAAAGLLVVYGVSRGAEVAARPAERAALVAACVANGGAHSIKLTEACLREEAFSHDPLLLAAARDAGAELNG